MPELPEVETVRLGLNRMIVGRTIKHVSSDWPKSFPNSQTDVDAFLRGAIVQSVQRRAKVLLIALSTDYTLVIHLKMTGQLVFVGEERFGAGHPNESLVAALPDRSTRVILTFTDGSRLFFNDQRKFGWVRLLPTVEVPEINFMKTVGPEPLSEGFTARVFSKRLDTRKNSTIKATLLDQKVIAGVGNIYADESLWGAKIHPATKVHKVSSARRRALYAELRSVLLFAIEKGGSTDKNYVSAEGRRGTYLSFARVFRREKQPCPRCGTIVIKSKVAGRGTHICPKCQRIVP